MAELGSIVPVAFIINAEIDIRICCHASFCCGSEKDDKPDIVKTRNLLHLPEYCINGFAQLRFHPVGIRACGHGSVLEERYSSLPFNLSHCLLPSGFFPGFFRFFREFIHPGNFYAEEIAQKISLFKKK
jgi:hypothetical protein